MKIAWIVAALLVASAIVFAVGVSIERSSEDHDEGAEQAEQSAEREGESIVEGEEGGESAEGSSEESEAGESEDLFGVNTESWTVVVAVVAMSLLLAGLLAMNKGLVIPGIVLLFAAGAAAFDVREVLHQIKESRTDVGVLAGITAALHGLAALGACYLFTGIRRGTSQVPQ